MKLNVEEGTIKKLKYKHLNSHIEYNLSQGQS